MGKFIKFAVILALGTALAGPLSAQQPGKLTQEQIDSLMKAGQSTDPKVAPKPLGQNPNGLHVYLRGGLKSHGEGMHDYPQFVADWSKILTQHGAIVDGSLHSPKADELKGVDVVVMYKGDAAYMTDEEKAALDAFVKRGGGLVSIHDSLCAPEPAKFAEYVGGSKHHGEVNWTMETTLPYNIKDPQSPIMKGITDLTIHDEAFYKMTWAPNGVHVLADIVIPDTEWARKGGGVGQTVPQIWTYEHTVPGGKPARAFVWMQGHVYANFFNPQIQDMLLRGIAWAGKRPVDELVDYKAPAPLDGSGAPPKPPH